MPGDAVTLTGTHFPCPAAVFDGGFHNDLFVNMFRDRQIKVKVEVFPPGTTPEVFVGVTVNLVFDLHFAPAVDFLAQSSGTALPAADHAVVADTPRFKEGRRRKLRIGYDRNITLVGAELRIDGKTVESELSNPGGNGTVHVGNIRGKLGGQILVPSVTPDVG